MEIDDLSFDPNGISETIYILNVLMFPAPVDIASQKTSVFCDRRRAGRTVETINGHIIEAGKRNRTVGLV